MSTSGPLRVQATSAFFMLVLTTLHQCRESLVDARFTSRRAEQRLISLFHCRKVSLLTWDAVGPEKGVPTDITTVGEFGLPSLGFTAELLAVIATLLATLGRSWRYATAGPILFYIPHLSPKMQPMR